MITLTKIQRDTERAKPGIMRENCKRKKFKRETRENKKTAYGMETTTQQTKESTRNNSRQILAKGMKKTVSNWAADNNHVTSESSDSTSQVTAPCAP